MTLTTGPGLTGPRLRLGGGAAAGVVVVCGRGRGVRPGGRGPGVRGEVLVQAGVRHGSGRAVGKIKFNFKENITTKKQSPVGQPEAAGGRGRALFDWEV